MKDTTMGQKKDALVEWVASNGGDLLIVDIDLIYKIGDLELFELFLDVYFENVHTVDSETWDYLLGLPVCQDKIRPLFRTF